MTQNEQVLAYLEMHRSISDAQAYEQLGIRRLAARVNNLRGEGHRISTVMCTEYSERQGRFVRFARYRMEE